VRRRSVLLALAACPFTRTFAVEAAADFDAVVPGRRLEFPRDAGAHPGHRIEWWYVTGHLRAGSAPALGFQVTFFRVRNRDAERNASRFSPRQLLFAHAAYADPRIGALLHDQRSGRVLPPLVQAGAGDTDVRIDDWFLRRDGTGYATRIASREFALELQLEPSQPVMLQGDAGFSRKGPAQAQASYYYSLPHLHVSGRVNARGAIHEVQGVAWLDHEWSSELLAPEASGWDWLGVNLDDGGALMVFRIRTPDGRTLWSHATLRPAGGETRSVAADDVEFVPRRQWRSPRSGVSYPVEMSVRVEDRTWRVEPLMDDQELDARASTGTLYWEGAVRVRDASGAGGRGYLELTGYAERVPF
jgi:predicted secreted hydrolase